MRTHLANLLSGRFRSPPDERRDFITHVSHRGRVIRVLIALLLSLVGLMPVPYAGWACGLVLFGPAAVLLGYAGAERRHRRVVILLSLPTLAGSGLALVSLLAGGVASAPFALKVCGVACLTTLFAAVLGRPPTA